MGHDQRKDAERDRLEHGTEEVKPSFGFQGVDIGAPVQVDIDCRQNQVESAGGRFDFFSVAGIERRMRSELERFLALGVGRSEVSKKGSKKVSGFGVWG